MKTAESSARWRSPDDVWLDHAVLRPEDLDWLVPAKAVTLWAVTVPAGLLASLPNLVLLDLRGGSGTSPAPAAGCTQLHALAVNQVRGVTDLSVLSTLTSLEFLDLYGLPRVTELPSMAPLRRLRRVQLGSMKGLTGLTGLHDAPAIEELFFSRAVKTAEGDAERLASHPTLREFDWFGEDVAVRQWRPFAEAVGKPKAKPLLARDWFAQVGGL
jgi:hypothetical protein